MLLWTIQDCAVWEQVKVTGSYAVSDEHIEFPAEEDDAFNHLNYAYRWLARQMELRVGPPPQGVHYPIWAWYKRYGQADGKPDMRASHYIPGKPCVRMKLDVPDYEVLLSDFDAWHHALNYCHLSATEVESEEFDKWCESLGVGFRDIGNWNLDTPELREVRATLEQSWERMLGVQPQSDENWHFPWEKRSFQATFWTLRRENVLSVERFISR